jgi:predicted DNA-binding protein YlxM (UPF0122 family)
MLESSLKEAATAQSASPFALCAEIEQALILDIVTEQCASGQQELLLLHYQCDMSLAEVARRFGVSRAAVIHMHQRALATMRQALRRMRIEEFRDI